MYDLHNGVAFSAKLRGEDLRCCGNTGFSQRIFHISIYLRMIQVIGPRRAESKSVIVSQSELKSRLYEDLQLAETKKIMATTARSALSLTGLPGAMLFGSYFELKIVMIK